MWILLALFISIGDATSPLPPKPTCQDYQEPLVPIDCGPNASLVRCPWKCSDKTTCPPTNCPCGPERDCCWPNCVCDNGYVRDSKTGICIKQKDCPSWCGANQHRVTNSTICPKTCGNRITYRKNPCNPFTGCVCNDGYVRPYDNATGPCIPVDNCPPIPGNCGLNEVAASCRVKCPPQSCERSYTTYLCLPSECEPGCDCIDNYLRNASNICILQDDCPIPGTSPPDVTESPIITISPIEVPRDEPTKDIEIVIERNASESSSSAQSSARSLSESSSFTITDKDGSISSQSSLNFSSSASSASFSSSNSSFSSSSSTSVTIVDEGSCPSKCRPTCAVPNPPGCSYKPYNASDPCTCKRGQVLSKIGGKCVNVSDCPVNLGCNGDPNAIVAQCPLPCPSTCDAPNAIPCRKACVPVGCQCLNGFILSKYGGKCILPDECPGGNPCGINENFLSCKVPCPSDFCPEEDYLRYPVCEVPSPCLSGCACKLNYKWLSRQDRTCISAETCPPVPCTRPNEEWNPCRPFCPKINCDEATEPCSPPFVRTCEPRCTCVDNYFRNTSEICVPLSKCPKKHCGA